tara:strand:+ start:1242 stop:1526 length:285 start_codon:yes stop_codon:yes gene_type:complete
MNGFGKKLNKSNHIDDELSKLSKKYRKIKKLSNSSIHEVNRIDGKEPKIDWTEYEQEVEEYYKNNPEEYVEDQYQNSLSDFLTSREDGQLYEED